MDYNEFNLIPTNSLISGAFDMLKLDGLDDPFTDMISVTACNMDESYFAKTVNFLNTINENYSNIKIKLYKAISESNNNAVLLESFTDYYVQTAAIVNKFLVYLKNLNEEFYNTVYSYIDDTEIIKDCRKVLMDEIKDYEDTTSEGLTYTISENIPDLSLIDNFNASLFDSLFKVNINDLSSETVKQTVTEMEIEKDISAFRARIIGSSEELSEMEFIKQLYQVFRNNDITVDKLNITAKDIRNIAEKWFSYYGIKPLFNQQYSSIERSYNSLLKKIEAVCNNHSGLSVAAFTNLMPGDIGAKKIEGKDIDTNGMMMSSDMMLQLNIYTKAKLDILQKYTDITCMVISAKMDAIKDMIRQDRGVLLKAIEVLSHPDDYYDARVIGGRARRDETLTAVQNFMDKS